MNSDYLRRHRAHDVEALLDRWAEVARRAELDLMELRPGVPLLRSRGPWREECAVYLSAGIHGDEPAGTEGLICWAESRIDWLRGASCLIIPCFNPDGLRQNARRDVMGTDLNREFHHTRAPLISAWRDCVEGMRFRLALCLHEDYDATGTYLYELGVEGESIGNDCLDACAELIPRESRPEVDGTAMERGLLFHGGELGELLEKMDEGLPEAIYLRVHHAVTVLTFETPSEFGLDVRVAAQVRCIDTALKWTGLG